MKSKFSVVFSFLFTLGLAACAGSSAYLPIAEIPESNRQVIQVDKAYDFVYLAVFDATNGLSGWAPLKTLKDEGLILLKNTQFSRFNDADSRVISLRIRRDSSTKTSFFLEPESQRVIGADEVMNAIRKKLGLLSA